MSEGDAEDEHADHGLRERHLPVMYGHVSYLLTEKDSGDADNKENRTHDRIETVTLEKDQAKIDQVAVMTCCVDHATVSKILYLAELLHVNNP